MNDLPPIKEIISKYNLQPKKSLGQNYILDLNFTRKIVRAAGDLKNYNVLEIGPGPGSLTRSILEAGARKVIVVEKDMRFVPALLELKSFYNERLEIINDDILKFNKIPIQEFPVKVIANLPYNIGTQILINFLTQWSFPKIWTSLTLMFQQEVANRIISKPGSKAYGRLSILSQFVSEVELMFHVSADVFTPVPKVDSSVLNFTPILEKKYNCNFSLLEKIVKLAFNKRRKMIRQSLRLITDDIERILLDAGINPQSRPEELSISMFCDLTNSISKLKKLKC